MSLDIGEEALIPALPEHAAIPIAFVVDRILEVRLADGGLGGMSLAETAVTDPYLKDYDVLEGAGPQCWPGRFDVSNWGLIAARRDGASVGGAVIAIKTPGLHMLSGRDDIAVLWDIRVSPRERGRGTGSALFRAAGTWAEARGCRWLKIETQNVNVRACRFYQKMGCTLGGIDRFAYPAQPAEVQLLWWKALASPDMKSSRPDLRAQPQAAAPASMGQQIGGQAGPGRLQSAYRSCLFSEPRDKGPGQQLAQSRQRNTDTARNWSWQVDEDATEVGMLPKADIRC